MAVDLMVGGAVTRLRELPDESVHCVITSPPFWGLRSYNGEPEMIGLEPTFDQHLDNLLKVFREVWRVLRNDGVFFCNYGDGFWSNPGNLRGGGETITLEGSRPRHRSGMPRIGSQMGLKPKDLMMMPARLALALQADGWYLRSEIVIKKDNPMPESCTDRPTSSHEKLFLLTKSGNPTYWTHQDGYGTRTKPKPDYRWINRESGLMVAEEPSGWKESGAWSRRNMWRGHDYFYDREAVRTPTKSQTEKMPDGWDTGSGGHGTIHRQGREKGRKPDKQRGHSRRHDGFNDRWDQMSKAEQQENGANLRNVWPVDEDEFAQFLQWKAEREDEQTDVLSIAVSGFPGAHFATFSPAIPETCIKAGSSEQGCCAACGAPWARGTDKGFIPQGDVSEEKGERGAAGQKAMDKGNGWSGFPRGTTRTSTINWHPTCECNAEIEPSRILDCFAGAGTTGLVAERLGRDSILIELSEQYVDMAEERIRSDNPLFTRITRR